MIIKSIELFNFRQYFGKQKIEFSQSASKNITVIHGENGSGKTALLNAFNWCLYQENDLPNPEKIVNEQAITNANNGEKVKAYIQIEFKQEGIDYIIKRSVQIEKINETKLIYKEPEVSLLTIDSTGNCLEENNVQNRIDQLLPNELRTYFFFDGERIDNLSKEEGSKDIKSAVKLIMGLEILERSMLHTEAARKKFRSDLKKSGDIETNKIINEIEELEKERELFKGKISIYDENLSSLNKEKQNIESRLKTIGESKKLQDERESLQKDKKLKEEAVKETKRKLNYFISKHGYLGFTSNIVKNANKYIKDEIGKSSNIVIKESVLQAIIQRGQCICGQKLNESSEHLNHLLQLKEDISSQDIQNVSFDMAGSLSLADEKRKQLYIEIKRFKEIEIELISQIDKIDEQLDEISTKLSDKNTEEISSLEQKRKDLEQQFTETILKKGQTQSELKRLEESLKEKEKIQSKMAARQEEERITRDRITACMKIEEVFKKIYEVQEVIVKEQLQERISKVYLEFLRKGYHITLSQDYELKVINELGNEVAMSQGERQITSLSFIGAIVDIAREQYKSKDKKEFNTGGIYPIVMDSPFGSLDSDHRKRVAQGIPKLADQVIVIVSTSQWKGEVAQQLENVIGKEYKLEYNDPRYNKDKPYEYTQVTEVN
jgi:DNA sulfur modification protein DndD